MRTSHSARTRAFSFRWLPVLVSLGFGVIAGFSCYERYRGPRDPSGDRVAERVELADGVTAERSLRFFAFGDSGTGGAGQRRVADAMRTVARGSVGLDFLMLLGDNFYPRGVTSSVGNAWDERIVEPYGPLGCAMYPVLGNHDRDGSSRAQIERSRIDPNWRMPAAYYTFELPVDGSVRAQFWALDTDRIREADSQARDQIDWLRRGLEASTARWKVVYGHHPIYSSSPRGDDEKMGRAIERLLIDHGVDMYIAGHDHTLQFLGPHDDVRYVVSGGGGGDDNAHEVTWRSDTAFAATRGGFAAITLTAQEAYVHFVRSDGATQFGTRWGPSE